MSSNCVTFTLDDDNLSLLKKIRAKESELSEIGLLDCPNLEIELDSEIFNNSLYQYLMCKLRYYETNYHKSVENVFSLERF